MSDYSSMSPPPPPPEGYGVQTRGERPASIRTALMIIWVYIALTVLGAVLGLLSLDEVIDETLAAQPADSPLTESMVRGSTILGLVVYLVVAVGLSVLLAVFLGKGRNWARIVITILTGIVLVAGVFSLAGSSMLAAQSTAAQTVLQVVTLLLGVALLFFLWKKESTQWLTGRG